MRECNNCGMICAELTDGICDECLIQDEGDDEQENRLMGYSEHQ